MRQTIRDTVAVFGQFGGLVGIVSESASRGVGGASAVAPDLPAVIILNTGIIHRVGAGRMSTMWARHVASNGHCVLRFDLSGVGDSERRQDTLAPAEAALADLRDAVDWLQSARGILRVILIGLCSGADLSLVYAGSDPRVCGMVIIDPSTPPTRGHYLRKLLTLNVWKRQAQTFVQRLRARSGQPVPRAATDASQNESTQFSVDRAREILSSAYRAAFDGGVQALALFTTGAAWYNYRDQLYDAFPEIQFTGNLQLLFFEHCDHTITHEANRVRLFQAVDIWLERTVFTLPNGLSTLAQELQTVSESESGKVVSVEF